MVLIVYNSINILTKHQTALVTPNFFLEAKAPYKDADVTKRQVCYDNALGVYVIYKLQLCGQDRQVYNGNAYAITLTYRDSILKMYITHPTQSVNSTTEYHMT